jgi:quinol monooxygenase YgiN
MFILFSSVFQQRGLTMSLHINVVRFKPKPAQGDAILKAHNAFDFTAWDGCLSFKMVTYDGGMCSILEWQSEAHMQAAMAQMITLLDSIRDQLDEISPDLGVTDPLSGPAQVFL